MAAFWGVVKSPKVVTSLVYEGGEVVSASAVAVIVVESDGGDPHLVYEQVREMVGKRVKVQITLEQLKI